MKSGEFLFGSLKLAQKTKLSLLAAVLSCLHCASNLSFPRSSIPSQFHCFTTVSIRMLTCDHIPASGILATKTCLPHGAWWYWTSTKWCGSSSLRCFRNQKIPNMFQDISFDFKWVHRYKASTSTVAMGTLQPLKSCSPVLNSTVAPNCLANDKHCQPNGQYKRADSI